MSSPLRIWHPFTNAAMDAPPLHVVRAERVYLYTKDGRRILDAVSSWWVNLHGHANPRIAEAIAQQALKMEHVIMAGFTHEAAGELGGRPRKPLAPHKRLLKWSTSSCRAPRTTRRRNWRRACASDCRRK